MWQERIRRYFLQSGIEDDPGFRKQIRRLSYIGLFVIGGVEVVVSTFMSAAYILLDPNPRLFVMRLKLGATLICLGLLTLASSRIRVLAAHARKTATASALVIAGVLTGGFLLMMPYYPGADMSIPGNITMIMLVAAAAIPFRPPNMLVFGCLVEVIYVAVAVLVRNFYHIGKGAEPLYVMFNLIITLLATALTALIYEQRRSAYEWHKRTAETSDCLRKAEARNLLAENAASVGRLAAALSHELNSPIGALISGVDTLLLLAGKQVHATPAEQQRLVLLQNELRKSIKLSTDRLHEIVRRMQRFSNLDAAEIQSANVNNLIQDVAALLEPKYQEKVRVELDLKPLPPLVCRPQQLSAVFSNLLGNAIDATRGEGRVIVSSDSRDSSIEVAFADNGRGLDSKALDSIFDPGFKVANGRVLTGNWSMFSSRQIVREHGGEIAIESECGKGTKVRVMLPVQTNVKALAALT